jgi:hypothetical protein
MRLSDEVPTNRSEENVELTSTGRPYASSPFSRPIIYREMFIRWAEKRLRRAAEGSLRGRRWGRNRVGRYTSPLLGGAGDHRRPVRRTRGALPCSLRRPYRTNGKAGGKLPAGKATRRSPARSFSAASRKAPSGSGDQVPCECSEEKGELTSPARPYASCLLSRGTIHREMFIGWVGKGLRRPAEGSLRGQCWGRDQVGRYTSPPARGCRRSPPTCSTDPRGLTLLATTAGWPP